jgi:hypothetical protein
MRVKLIRSADHDPVPAPRGPQVRPAPQERTGPQDPVLLVQQALRVVPEQQGQRDRRDYQDPQLRQDQPDQPGRQGGPQVRPDPQETPAERGLQETPAEQDQPDLQDPPEHSATPASSTRSRLPKRTSHRSLDSQTSLTQSRSTRPEESFYSPDKQPQPRTDPVSFKRARGPDRRSFPPERVRTAHRFGSPVAHEASTLFGFATRLWDQMS